MLELDIIGAWDARAVNLDQEEADRNVYEFDLTLWNLLSTLAKERPDDAASQFSLGMNHGSLAAANRGVAEYEL
ncbi:hypothetical protein FSG74_022815, partial [Escherichia coli]|nr:hypothetical protein [Escherichia coli]